MAIVELTRGYFATIDEADVSLIAGRKWRAVGKSPHIYAVTGHVYVPTGAREIYMHRLITDARENEVVDHVDDNGLNNRRGNLRVCTHGENVTRGRLNKSRTGFRGVQPQTLGPNFTATIAGIHLGSFTSAEAAAEAYDKAAIQRFGQFARTNRALGNFDRAAASA